MVHPFRPNEPGIIGDNVTINTLIGLYGSIPNFKRSRSNFNNAELLSLNAIFNPTEKLKIKTLAFFNSDETRFFRNATETVNVNSVDFTNSEEYQLNNKNKLGFGKFDFIYSISKTKSLEATTKYNSEIENNGTGYVIVSGFNANRCILASVDNLGNILSYKIYQAPTTYFIPEKLYKGPNGYVLTSTYNGNINNRFGISQAQ